MSFTSWLLRESFLAIHIKDGKEKAVSIISKSTLPRIMRREHIVEELSFYGYKTYKIAKKEGNKRAMLFLHGGAYEKGFAMPHWVLIERMLKALDVDVYAPDYPFLPHKCEETMDMVVEVYKKMLKTYDSKDIFFMGDSAGGGLALALCMYLRDHDMPQPAKNVMISPWLDVSMSNPDMEKYDYFDPWLNREELIVTGKRYAGKLGVKHPYCSPIYGDPRGLCKMYITFGTYDILCPDGLKFKKKCEELKVDLRFDLKEEMLHTYPMLPVKEAKEAREKIVEFILESE